METIRAFIAVALPENVKTHLAAVIQVLAGQLPPPAVRWVTPERMHLTVRFLGDTEVDRLPALVKALDTAMLRQPPFALYLE